VEGWWACCLSKDSHSLDRCDIPVAPSKNSNSQHVSRVSRVRINFIHSWCNNEIPTHDLVWEGHDIYERYPPARTVPGTNRPRIKDAGFCGREIPLDFPFKRKPGVSESQSLDRCRTGSDRRGNTPKGCKDFDLKAKARISSGLSYMCHIRSTSGAVRGP